MQFTKQTLSPLLSLTLFFTAFAVSDYTSAQADSQATVYTLHVSPDAPAVDIFAGNSELVSNISFGELSPAIQVDPGAYTLDFFHASSGSLRPSSSPASTVSTPSLEAGKSYLVIASGYLNASGNQEELEIIALESNFTQDSSNARVRLVHASPDAPAVDIGIVNDGSITQTLASNVTLGTASSDAGISFPPDSTVLGIAPASNPSEVVSVFNLSLSGGAGNGLFAIVSGAFSPEAQEESLRLLLVNTTSSRWNIASISPQTNEQEASTNTGQNQQEQQTEEVSESTDSLAETGTDIEYLLITLFISFVAGFLVIKKSDLRVLTRYYQPPQTTGTQPL